MNQPAKYLGQRSLRSKVIFRTHKHAQRTGHWIGREKFPAEMARNNATYLEETATGMLATALIDAEHGSLTVFARWRPCVPTHLTLDSMGPYESTSQTASRSVQPFLQSSQSWPSTHRHRPLCSNNPHLAVVPAMRAKNSKVRLKFVTVIGFAGCSASKNSSCGSSCTRSNNRTVIVPSVV